MNKQIVKDLIAKIETAGTSSKGWKTLTPRNIATEKPYNGMNRLRLALEGSDLYATFNQVKKLNGKVKKGAKGIPVVFFQIEEDGGQENEKENKKEIKRFFHRVSYVFKVEDCELDPELIRHIRGESCLQENKDIEKDLQPYTSQLKIEKGKSDARYLIDSDTVEVPSLQKFNSQSEYYATLIHELAHSTGAPHRLNRFQNYTPHKQGAEYAQEELIAELTSLFAIDGYNLENKEKAEEKSLLYLKEFLKNAKENKETILVKAISQAEKAKELIFNCV